MYETQTDHHNYGAPDSLGSGSGAPSSRRRASTGPQYIRSVFTDPRVRGLVAGYLEQQVATIAGPDASNADQFIAGQLDDVINELRGTT